MKIRKVGTSVDLWLSEEPGETWEEWFVRHHDFENGGHATHLQLGQDFGLTLFNVKPAHLERIMNMLSESRTHLLAASALAKELECGTR